MNIDYDLWLVTNLYAAGVRAFADYGATFIASPDIGAFARVVPIIVLFWATVRQFRRGKVLRGLSLIATLVYFLYNRVAVFNDKPLVLAELLGNAGLILLALTLILPQRRDHKEDDCGS